MRELVDVHYPNAEYIRVVQDNLSTHSGGALYQALPPPKPGVCWGTTAKWVPHAIQNFCVSRLGVIADTVINIGNAMETQSHM
jgi:hypothetical protein